MFDKKLNDDGEKLDLSIPGDLDNEGVRQYIRIDRLDYSDGANPDDFPGNIDPWPTGPDGAGWSLTRINPAAYGNNASNWQAAAPTPGSI